MTREQQSTKARGNQQPAEELRGDSPGGGLSVPCPCCDIGANRLLHPDRPEKALLEALALGVTLGVAFGDLHAVTELCCSEHRFPYVMAMARAAIAANEPAATKPEERPR